MVTPGRFSTKWPIIGQQSAITYLWRSLELGRVAHAYLFVGPKRVGKTTLARLFAQALNCTGEKAPCGACSSCGRINRGTHPDVRTVALIPQGPKDEQRKEISIDDVREMEHEISLRPMEAEYKIFIVEEAEFLSHEAANSILKTLEEPPERVVLLLLTANEPALLPTILSRCHRVELRPVREEVLDLGLQEHFGVAPEQARRLAHLSEGLPGWAVAALSDPSLPAKRAALVVQSFETMRATRARQFALAADLAKEFSESRQNVREALQVWSSVWRDILLLKTTKEPALVNSDHTGDLIQFAEQYMLESVRGFLDALYEAQLQLAHNANPRLVFEVLMLRLPKNRLAGKAN